MVTSYCPDGAAACEVVLDANRDCSVFYDLDTPVTLSQLAKGHVPPYLPVEGLSGLRPCLKLHGRRSYRSTERQAGSPKRCELIRMGGSGELLSCPACPEFSSDLSYLGTYAKDRQRSLEELLIRPARQLPDCRFVIAGAMYPQPERWPSTIRHYAHIAPPQHSSFYSSSPLTLSVTRGTMAAMGYCPSGRLFEASACGTAVLSDWWKGLDSFFTPGEEILIARSTSEAIAALTTDSQLLAQVGARAKQRTLDCHTATHRARRLMELIEQSSGRRDEWRSR